ncbi:hypothetical protein [Pseudemcibacter aquimaris]|uniref:hypothetical protein n=1 Tax=Pseudemcibacter aquimaris TaxID=2857064 RepID=UPI0020123F8F|nr:hypothetical protein [Pseudemcibacter aquimaris]MCC3861297.1 hypothetical protein [Pseudemcibacter aquimaris]WDU58071.1 hypothetical protein KW060_12805 [Pseudemcibacter aquimaris]
MGTIIIQAVDDGKDWSSVETDDVDILYVLEGVGRSRCYLYLTNEVYHMGPTHVFGSPLDVMLDGITEFLQSYNDINFTWYDEPGTYDWFIYKDKKEPHVMEVEIIEYEDIESDLKGKLPKSEVCKTTKFRVKIKVFCTCLLKQIEKIELLLSEKSYSDRRKKDFDFIKIQNFKEAYDKRFGY